MHVIRRKRSKGHLTICFSTLNILLNCLLFIDLFLTMRNPFYQRSKRIPKYYALAFLLIAIINCTIYLTFVEPKDGDIFSFHEKGQGTKFLELIKNASFILIFAPILSTILVVSRLMSKGTSKDLKRKICIRHLVYFFLFMLSFVGI